MPRSDQDVEDLDLNKVLFCHCRLSHPSLSPFFQQWRLIPYLAAAYALDHFTKSTFMNFVEFQIGQVMRDNSDRQVSENRNMRHKIMDITFHVYISTLNPSFISNSAEQKCRILMICTSCIICSHCSPPCPSQAELGKEIHAIGCSSKPLGSWTAQRGIQECREACGGHGYLAS